MDELLARVRDALKQRGQWEDTLLLVFSDHGEAFYEHGRYDHGYIPFDEVVKVPLVISWPRLLRHRSRRVVDGLTWHLDLLPTVLSLAGVPAPEGLAGLDLAPILNGDARLPADRSIFPAVLQVANRRPLPLRRLTLSGQQKWIEGDRRFGDAEGLLFDLATDPREQHNLRASQRATAADLAARAQRYDSGLTRHPPRHQDTGQPLSDPFGGHPPALSASDRRKLIDLGYAE